MQTKSQSKHCYFLLQIFKRFNWLPKMSGPSTLPGIKIWPDWICKWTALSHCVTYFTLGVDIIWSCFLWKPQLFFRKNLELALFFSLHRICWSQCVTTQMIWHRCLPVPALPEEHQHHPSPAVSTGFNWECTVHKTALNFQVEQGGFDFSSLD